MRTPPVGGILGPDLLLKQVGPKARFFWSSETRTTPSIPSRPVKPTASSPTRQSPFRLRLLPTFPTALLSCIPYPRAPGRSIARGRRRPQSQPWRRLSTGSPRASCRRMRGRPPPGRRRRRRMRGTCAGSAVTAGTRNTRSGTRAPAAAASSSCTRTASSSGSTTATRASAR
jgi:hypothetical protein